MQALYHGDATEFNWANGDATVVTTTGTLALYMALDWIFYLLFCYLTLINYSHFIAAKKWTDFTSQLWAIS